MDKDHLKRLQIKVRKLMQASSEDSEGDPDPEDQTLQNSASGDNPETVRKCITLINQNRELKALLEKERNKNKKVTQELLKVREEKAEIEKIHQQKLIEYKSTLKNDSQDIRHALRLQGEIEEWKKKCKQLD